MQLGVVRERGIGERRVALVPDSVARLAQKGHHIMVERGAGEHAHFSDTAYTTAGASLADSYDAVTAATDIVIRVGKPTTDEVNCLRPETALIGMLQAATSPELLDALAQRGITSFSLERMPRIARAQSMDVLSSQSSLSGYKAALIAAGTLAKFFPMMMTAAGTIAPARVLVMGAGVAGLQAIATARRLGAVVQGYDIRLAAKEQVESLGAVFVSPQLTENAETSGGYATQLSEQAQERERESMLRIIGGSDVVITTALVPGRKAPILVTRAMVEAMAPGSVVVDIAAEAGGNCELTVPAETIVHNDVTIIGPVNLPSTLPTHASQLFSRNVLNFVEHIVRDGQLSLDLDDVIIGDACVTHAGSVRHGLGRAEVPARA